MPAVRVVLRDGSERIVRTYRVEGETLRVGDAAETIIQLPDIDVERTLAANGEVDFGPSSHPFDQSPPALELLSLESGEKGSFRVVQGRIRNVSPVDLDHVVARVWIASEAGDSTALEEALVDRTPLRAGAESSFRVVMRNPGGGAARVGFRQLLGDELSAAGEASLT